MYSRVYATGHIRDPVSLIEKRRGLQCRKFEGNLAEASASRSCGGGPGGLLFICLFVCLFIYLFLNLAEAACLPQCNLRPWGCLPVVGSLLVSFIKYNHHHRTE